MKKTLRLIFLAPICSLILTGCVAGRRTIALPVATSEGATSMALSKGEISIAAVTDNRIFENKPTEPSTASIDGDVTKLSAEDKARMIGRQRNTYGRAMGDVALPAGESVINRSRLLLEQGLRARGYSIGSDPSAANTASLSIDQFWAWFTPGMFSVTFEARVFCTITLKKTDRASTIVVKGEGVNKGQVASDANLQLVYDRAFKDFLAKLNTSLESEGF